MVKGTSNFTSKDMEFSLDNPDSIQPIAHALSSKVRLDILTQISFRGMNINELAKALNLPVSTVALNVQVLEQSGLVIGESQPGIRGMMKVCTRRLDNIHFSLIPTEVRNANEGHIEVPVGRYCLAQGIRPTCGMTSREKPFHMDDNPLAFFHPNHFDANIIWFREGSVDYQFPILWKPDAELDYLEFSFEACSEAPGYLNDWESDIFVEVNNQYIGIWRCPGDFGGRRGILNPDWWSDVNTQYGYLKTWRITTLGSFLENKYISATTLKSLRLAQSDHINLRIGVSPIGERAGGLNLFGKGFGDFSQDIIMKYGFR